MKRSSVAGSSGLYVNLTIGNREPGSFQLRILLFLKCECFHVQEYPVVTEDMLAAKPVRQAEGQKVKR